MGCSKGFCISQGNFLVEPGANALVWVKFSDFAGQEMFTGGVLLCNMGMFESGGV